MGVLLPKMVSRTAKFACLHAMQDSFKCMEPVEEHQLMRWAGPCVWAHRGQVLHRII